MEAGMILTKFEHACFGVKKDGQILLVDPGNLTSDLDSDMFGDVVAVAITHQHADHFDISKLAEIFAKNPEVIFLGYKDVILQIDKSWTSRVVSTGESVKIGPFELEFLGGDHAIIHSSIPQISNLGVLIDEKIYYPGDSFVPPNKPVDLLLLPTGAPWLRINESLDFLKTVRPKIVVPTHDAILSDSGKKIYYGLIDQFAQKNDVIFRVPDKSVEL